MQRCELCGTRYVECTHHLISGSSGRKLADEDGLTMKLCNSCHNMAIKPVDRIHGNIVAEKLSKMLGQAIWERNYYEKGGQDNAREQFIKRYGKSFL